MKQNPDDNGKLKMQRMMVYHQNNTTQRAGGEHGMGKWRQTFFFETGGASTANKGAAPMQLGVVGKTQDEVTIAHVCVIKRGSYGFSAKGGGFLEKPSRLFSEYSIRKYRKSRKVAQCTATKRFSQLKSRCSTVCTPC